MSVTARASLSATAATTPWAGDLTITVSCTVTNTGDRRGKEVVQLYVADLHAQVPRPVRELKAFAKITLEPGQAATVTFPLEPATCPTGQPPITAGCWKPADSSLRWARPRATCA
jgi:beta-glucosidase